MKRRVVVEFEVDVEMDESKFTDRVENARADAMGRIADEHLRSVAPRLLEALEEIVEDAVRYEDTADSRLMRIAIDAIALARDVPAFTKRVEAPVEEKDSPAVLAGFEDWVPPPEKVGGVYLDTCRKLYVKLTAPYSNKGSCFRVLPGGNSAGYECCGETPSWKEEAWLRGLKWLEEDGSDALKPEPSVDGCAFL